jgi:hypothetical protein
MLNVRVRASHIKGLPKFKLTFEDDKYNLKWKKVKINSD